MKREIKLRGKSKTTNTWLYGDLLRNEQGAFAVVPPFKLSMDNECNLYEVDENTIGQFTGLLDRNQNPIYEGDILMCIGQREDNKGRKYYRTVVYDNGSFCMTVPEYMVLSPLRDHIADGKLGWEVTGNIYDNKDLYLL